mgnify:CR=1 FL=1
MAAPEPHRPGRDHSGRAVVQSGRTKTHCSRQEEIQSTHLTRAAGRRPVWPLFDGGQKMARKRLLTFSSDRRWRKQVSGVMYYFGGGKSKDDLRSYREAEKKYLDFAAQRTRSSPVIVRISTATVLQVAEKYVQHLEERCNRQEISVSYFIRFRSSVNSLAAYLGHDRQFVEVSELDLEAYKTATLRCPVSTVTDRPISPATAKGHLDAVKALYRWAYKTRLIDEQPRNLLDYTSFSLPQPSVRVCTIDEIRRLWAAAPDRTRAFMALALNAGFGQSDVSDLRMREVDLSNGVIEHARVKTGIVTRHKLWSVTADLLSRHRRDGAAPSDRWFVTEEGGPLVWQRLDDARLKKGDAIKNAFWRVQQETEINGARGFYSLRKTAATEIERIDPLVTSMFLGHSPKEMKRFYALRNWDALDRAVIEMGKQCSFLTTNHGES